MLRANEECKSQGKKNKKNKKTKKNDYPLDL